MNQLAWRTFHVLCLCLILSATMAQALELKVYMSVDMEGITGVVHGSQTGAGGADYNRARGWMALDVNAAVKGVLDAGATDILVNDAHGGKRNIVIV